MARILIVEDAPDTRELMRLTLEMNDHEIVFAETGEECLAAIENAFFDAILMDISLPGEISGLNLVRILRGNADFDATPILAVTAHAAPEDQQRAFDAGCDEYITKPILDLIAFAETVAQFARNGRTNSAREND